MTWLHVICGLVPPPPIKNPGYAYDRYRVKMPDLNQMYEKKTIERALRLIAFVCMSFIG